MPMQERLTVPSAGPLSDDVDILCVDPARVKEIWPHVRHHIARAFVDGSSDDTTEAVEADVLSGRQLLWMASVNSHVIAAVTTALISTPRHKLCLLTSGGGSDVARWLGGMSKIESYARAEGCDKIRVMGRAGWKRMFPEFHEPFVVLDKNLKD